LVAVTEAVIVVVNVLNPVDVLTLIEAAEEEEVFVVAELGADKLLNGLALVEATAAEEELEWLLEDDATAEEPELAGLLVELVEAGAALDEVEAAAFDELLEVGAMLDELEVAGLLEELLETGAALEELELAGLLEEELFEDGAAEEELEVATLLDDEVGAVAEELELAGLLNETLLVGAEGELALLEELPVVVKAALDEDEEVLGTRAGLYAKSTFVLFEAAARVLFR